MTWGAVAVAGASLVGGALASNASKSASKSAASAELAGIESQERMFERSLEMQEPYRNAGYSSIEGLQGLMDPTQRASLLSDYYDSAEFKGYQSQAEESILRNAAATGGLRGGNTQSLLATVAPQLGADYLNTQQNILTGLGNWGIGAASQGSNQATALGQSIANSQANIGSIYAQNAINQGNIWGNTAQTLGGIGYNYFGG